MLAQVFKILKDKTLLGHVNQKKLQHFSCFDHFSLGSESAKANKCLG